MARIALGYGGGVYHASIRGSLSARDLARLERACGPALEHRHPPLVVRLHQVTSVDEAAGLFLQHLRERGVEIRGS